MSYEESLQRLAAMAQQGRFEEGVSADPTENMSEEDKKRWWDMHAEHKDNFKKAAAEMEAALASLDAIGRFEEGVSADPTEGMSEEDKKKWWAMHEKHKDNFKAAADDGMDVSIAALENMARFEEGVSADPTKDMSEEDKKKWWAMHDKHKDNFKAAADDNGDVALARFEEGVSADPTKDMSEEDKKKWWAMHAEHKDNFKAASGTGNLWAAVYGDGSLFGATEDLRGSEDRYWPHEVKSDPDFTIYELANVPSTIRHQIMLHGTSKQELSDGYQAWDKAKKFVVGPIQPMHRAASVLEAKWGRTVKEARVASGLYGFKKSVQNCCESATGKLDKAAARLAREAYAKDSGVGLFLSTHIARTKSVPAKILVAAMKSELAPKLASDKTAKTIYGLYGHNSRTANIGLAACTALREEAGRIAADLHTRKADHHTDITGFLQTHAKAARCLRSKLLHEAYPEPTIKLAATASVGPATGTPKVASVTEHPERVGEWLIWED